MNKLLEAGNKVRERILSLADSEGRFDYGALDMIEETVREVCSEYARSVVPEPWRDAPTGGEHNGFIECRDQTFSRIDQDLLSLKEK